MQDQELVVWTPLFLDPSIGVFRPSSPLRLPHLKFLFVCLFVFGRFDLASLLRLPHLQFFLSFVVVVMRGCYSPLTCFVQYGSTVGCLNVGNSGPWIRLYRHPWGHQGVEILVRLA